MLPKHWAETQMNRCVQVCVFKSVGYVTGQGRPPAEHPVTAENLISGAGKEGVGGREGVHVPDKTKPFTSFNHLIGCRWRESACDWRSFGGKRT
ncbi:hypothetical protein E2C01_075448 [Portunus trituberculatus]|uniref:Uncharacterized protein n=1 Tax=Portunus trituberculatus TaxID=210409 RepID=A0A5B7IF37_PORTR|nr:hypothetical protein [Portunus trituberculatus]